MQHLSEPMLNLSMANVSYYYIGYLCHKFELSKNNFLLVTTKRSKEYMY